MVLHRRCGCVAYWIALVFALLFPGTAWLDPEFVDQVNHSLGLNPQQFVSYVLLIVLAVAISLAMFLPW